MLKPPAEIAIAVIVEVARTMLVRVETFWLKSETWSNGVVPQIYPILLMNQGIFTNETDSD